MTSTMSYSGALMPADSSQSSAHTAGGGRSTCGARDPSRTGALGAITPEHLTPSHSTLRLCFSGTPPAPPARTSSGRACLGSSVQFGATKSRTAARAPRRRTREAVLSACWAEALATACRLRAGSLAVRDGVKSRCPPSLPPAAAPFAACSVLMQKCQPPKVDLNQLATGNA